MGLRRLVARPLVPTSGLSSTTTTRARLYHWNRCARLSSWLPPEGIKVVWVGMRNAEGEVYCWSTAGTGKHVSVLGTSLRFLLAGGLRGEGLASPHPILGAISCARLRAQLVFTGDAARAVFHLFSPGPDARLSGRCVPEGPVG